MEHAHTKSVDDLVKYFKTDLEFGLSDDQVEDYQNKYGFNGSFLFKLHHWGNAVIHFFLYFQNYLQKIVSHLFLVFLIMDKMSNCENINKINVT